MKFAETTVEHIPVIALEGRLDSAAAARCEAYLLEKAGDGRAALILDLEKVDYASGSGLRSLILAARMAHSRRITFAVCNLRGQVAQMIELGELAAELNSRPDVDSAICELST
jgi:anti-anti-sigma factor